MKTSRQAIADLALHQGGWLQRTSNLTRYAARKAAYSNAYMRNLLERPSVSTAEAADRWDRALSETNESTYLGQTIAVDTANAMLANIIPYYVGDEPAVLDVGCAAGSLVHQLRSCSRYLGVDISQFAINAGRTETAHLLHATLEVADIREFNTDRRWDVITFNEMLYYLNTDDALQQVLRYSRFLRTGVICIIMKHDPKSLAIFQMIGSQLDWVDGMLWQRKPFSPDYTVRINREQPGMLLGVFKPR